MQISKFRVERYRSIERAESIDLTKLTTLVGPNNEGKSNILRAIVVGLEALSTFAEAGRSTRHRSGILQQRLGQFESYTWARDFPMRLQQSTPGASSMFELEFALDQAEVAAFKDEVGHHLNGELKVRVLIGNGGKAQLKVVKRGPGSAGLNANLKSIAAFISRRIRVEYIPVARSFDQSEFVVRREAAAIFRQVTATEEYARAAETLNRLLSEALRPLEERVLDGVQQFLPSVTSVTIRANATASRLGGPDVDIDIDDGQLTSLAAKGDGVQSLVAISLVRVLARQSPERTYLLAVEEPEAHLHPGAVHKLREVLDEIAERDQVILTTHNPILVRRDDPRSNILVRNNAAAPAPSLKAVRDSLGVRLPDNMASAELVLLVEGRHDATIVRRLLRASDPGVARALQEGRLEIHDANGASNLCYQYRLYRDSVCSVHVLVDDDQQGRKARQELETKEGLTPLDVTMVSVNGMGESEIEDLFDRSAYADVLETNFNVIMRDGATHHAKRFALRMKDHFVDCGQPWNDSVESHLKSLIAARVESLDVPPIVQSRRGVVDALARAVAKKLRLTLPA